MELGILLLRVVLGALLIGHALFKVPGMFGGPGPKAAAQLFESWGLRPGKPFVLLAATSEFVAGVLLVLGLATPLAVAMAIGAMTVACCMNALRGFWAQFGGLELPLVYAAIAVALAFTGPGAWSIDHNIGLDTVVSPVWGLGALLLGVGPASASAGMRNGSEG